MEFYDEIIQRADIKQVRSFIIHGKNLCQHKSEIAAFTDFDLFMRSLNLPQDKYDEWDRLSIAYAQSIRSTYSEIGMKAGARLIYQLLFEEEI